ncbi:hypothetical protein HMPREF0208_02775 [Citrobacter koseri]|nr:hypothetical protein HMPREF3220_01714 [Citrobacter koseri]KXB43183.1 hypothetical protein HMPREF0208_02775 [Citrobacter koseri]
MWVDVGWRWRLSDLRESVGPVSVSATGQKRPQSEVNFLL